MKLLALACTCAAMVQATTAASCFPPPATTTATTTDLSSTTDFGLSLFKTLFPYQENRNLFFSPYSIWSALTLAYFGSRGETEAQLRQALGVGSKQETLAKWRALENLYSGRQAATQYEFNMANRAYFDTTVPLTPCMTDTLNSELRVVDMARSVEVAGDINGWVSNTTKGRITEVVSPGDLSNSNMVLANAAFFRGTWLHQFKKAKTEKKIFYSSRSDLTMVNMMTQTGNFKTGVSEELGAQVLELPYNGEQLSMVILLPPFITGDQGFDAMVDRLNASTLHQALGNLWSTKVEVSIPKFKIQESVGNKLITALKTMGVNDLFDRSKANLTEFSADGGLSVGKAVHKAFVEVSEEGTEAAAATVLIGFRMARPVGPTKFDCKHPFLFMIYDHEASNILFMGAYKSPKGSSRQ